MTIRVLPSVPQAPNAVNKLGNHFSRSSELMLIVLAAAIGLVAAAGALLTIGGVLWLLFLQLTAGMWS
ncbi:hypothetical protein [Amycolatopsis palatopharyngis]|uniref:hypothetical protein n=1 Tax=Amycolatopsis palatopharyngis TaxID=187982 RepID=UPI000E225054|nr:hypothetical protein [Amycolatopsis palatopharyngis]